MKEFIDKLIGRLEKIPVGLICGECPNILKCNEIEDSGMGKNVDLCGATIKQLAIENVKQLAEEHKGGWIPCSERLPENNKVVLCWVKSTTIASGETYIIGSCDRGFWFLQTYEIGHHHFPVKDYEVVAWQQLPEPLKPKEEQHDMSGWKGAFMNTFLAGKGGTKC